MMNVLIVQLTPETYFCADNIFLVVVVLDHPIDVNVIEVQPSLVISVGDTEVVAHSHIEIKRTILGNDHLMLGSRHTSAPPLNYVSLLHLNVVCIHPVHKFLSRVQICQNLMLLAPVVAFNLLLPDPLLCQELGLISQTSQDNLISSEMNDWVRENVEDLSEYFFD